MNRFIKRNFWSIVKGGIITLGLAVMLNNAGMFVINPAYVSTPLYIIINTLTFIFCWIFFTYLLQKYSNYKVIGLVALIVGANVADIYLMDPFNPITIPLVILFWLGVGYFVLPDFFIKYKVAILSVYGVVLSYYLFFRMAPDYVDRYHYTFVSFLLIPIPVLAGLWLYEQWRWLKTLQADKGKAELALLKSQINPHFFFNTLNNLYGLVVEKSEKAPEVVLKLSDMMRYTIYEGKEDVVLLKDEISYLQNYIELHKIRYHKKVEIDFTHDVHQGLKVAPLLFIVLLENAFKHGVEQLHDNAFIRLSMRSIGPHKLAFTIENSYDESRANQKTGIGLENLRKRLAYLYPNHHELRVNQNGAVYSVRLNLELI